MVYILYKKNAFSSIKTIFTIPAGCGFVLIFQVLLLKTLGLSGMFLFDIMSENYKYYSVRYIGILLMLSYIFAVAIGSILIGTNKLTRKTTAILCLLVVCIGLWSLYLIDYSFSANRKIEIIEVTREEQCIYQDDYKDITTLKIKNNFSEKLKFDNLYISTDEDYLKQYCISDVSIQPEGILDVSFETKKIGISKNKTFVLYISSNLYDGDIITSLSVPELSENHSYCFDENTGEWQYLSIDKDKYVYVEKPEFSVSGGFYSEPFNLLIEVPEGTKVYYSTDSSDPTVNSTLYSGENILIYDRSSEDNVYRSIKNTTNDYLRDSNSDNTPVNKCFVLRAVAIDENGNCSDIVTHSYFVDLDEYKNTKIVSLVSNPHGLFSDEEGICVTGSSFDTWYRELIKNDPNIEIIDPVKSLMANYNQKWERTANFEVFNNDEIVVNQLVGIKVNGASRRGKALKDFSIYARKKYTGSKFFDGDILDNDLNVHSVVLRQGDANVISQYLVLDRDIAAQKGQKVTVFLNGEYWYDTFMLEKYSDDYYTVHYGLDNNNIQNIKLGYWADATDEEKSVFSSFMNYALSLDLSKEDDYRRLSEVMDIQSYVDYQCVRIFMADMDYTEEKNNYMFRTIEKENDVFGDTRYRWGLYDLDLATYDTRVSMEKPVDKNSQVDTFSIKGAYNDYPVNEQKLYAALKNNADFRRMFVNTMMDLINKNYKEENVSALLSEIGFDISWNDYFFVERPEYITKYMEKEFDLKGTKVEISLSSNIDDAPFVLNTIEVEEGFRGCYYTDYCIDLSAGEIENHTFDHWEVNGVYYDNNSKISIEVEKGGMIINAVYS